MGEQNVRHLVMGGPHTRYAIQVAASVARAVNAEVLKVVWSVDHGCYYMDLDDDAQ